MYYICGYFSPFVLVSYLYLLGSSFFFFLIWNASRICVSSLHRGHANLLSIVPILVYVLPKRALLVTLAEGSICYSNLSKINFWFCASFVFLKIFAFYFIFPAFHFLSSFFPIFITECLVYLFLNVFISWSLSTVLAVLHIVSHVVFLL